MLTFYLKLIVVPLLLIIMYFKTEEEKYDKNKGRELIELEWRPGSAIYQPTRVDMNK